MGTINRALSHLMPIIFTLIVLTPGCTSLPERNPLPPESADIAQIPGIPNARHWGDLIPPYIDDWVNASKDDVRKRFSGVYGQKQNLLAISGGGAKGAFGAGILVGWTATGTRPQFTMVTGISTGALTAPFAFLGSEYDAQLQEVYTRYSTADLVTKRTKFQAMHGDSIADSAPLRAMIARYVDDKMVQAIAEEYRKGRILYIGTTNLDAERPVIWNIGLIANSEMPGAKDLIHDILLASASIPVSFPPVLFEVEANGQRYDELHVDGGITNQLFLYQEGVDWHQIEKTLASKGTTQTYIIRNSKLKPDWVTVERSLSSIAGRSVSSLIRTQGIGDLYRVYLSTQRDGLGYNLAYIPGDFDVEPKEPFDPEYMNKLFELGYNKAKVGYPWANEPPGLLQ